MSPWSRRPEPFVYPYSFVRLGKPAPREASRGQERFEGLCGRITCKLKTITPLCIPDSEGAALQGDHWTLRFFRIDGEAAIPGSSLKGAIRSIFETITQSAFSVLDTGAVSHRLRLKEDDDAPAVLEQFRPVVVLRLPDGDEPGEVGEFEDVAWVANTAIEQVAPGSTRVQPGRESPAEGLPWPAGGPTGVIHITGLLPTKYRNAHFVFPRGLSLAAFKRGEFPSEARRKLPSAVAGTYDEMRTDLKYPVLRKGQLLYARVRGDEITAVADARVPRIGYERSIGETLANSGTDFLPPTSVDRLDPASRVFGVVTAEGRGDDAACGGLLRFSTARPLGALSPADFDTEVTLRILGQPHPTAAAFYLQHQQDSGQASSPDEIKPFMKGREVHRSVLYDDVDDNGDPLALLRGRKHYWHHPQAATERSEYDWTQDRWGLVARQNWGRTRRTNQNATVELLREGRAMTFRIDFEGLRDWELGALLWSLRPEWPERDLAIRLGRGKPLGLGAVLIQTQVQIIERERWYRSLDAHRPTDATEAQKGEWQRAFYAWLAQSQGAPLPEGGTRPDQLLQAVAEIPFWQDVLALLDTAGPPRFAGQSAPPPVRYPRFYAGDQAAGREQDKQVRKRTFNWFKPFKDGHRDPTEAYVPLATGVARFPMKGEKDPR